MIIFEKLSKLLRPLQRYGLFILEIVGWVVVLYFLTPLLISIFQVQFPKVQVSFSDFILLITAAFILAYTYEAKKMRQESIFQRKMSCAVDIHFKMTGRYQETFPNFPYKRKLGELSTAEGLNSVSRLSFLSGVMKTPIGECGSFQKVQSENKDLTADYFIKTENGQKDFLRALKIQDGKIRAGVLMTNGIKFIYTYNALHENWKKTLKGAKNLNDQFILVKKELNES